MSADQVNVRTSGEIDLNAMTPMEAGQAAARLSALPVLFEVSNALAPEDRLRMWACALSTITGAMTATVGAEAAIAVLETIAKQVPKIGDEAARELH